MAVKEKKEQEQELSVDDAFLKDFIAKGGKVADEAGSTVDESNVDALLEEVAGDNTPANTTPKQNKLHKKAVAKEVADTSKEDAIKAQKEQDRIERLQEQDRKRRQSKAINVASKVGDAVKSTAVDPVINRAGNVVDRVSNLPTTGGIGLLLAILIFLLFVVIAVNAAGDTRIKQFWYMLNGRAKLIGRQMVGHGGAPSSSTAPDGTPQATLPGGATVSTGLSPKKPTLSVGPVGIQRSDTIIPTPWGTIDIPDISLGARPITG